MTTRYTEPTRLGPWIIDGRTPEDPWTFNCHNERNGQRAIVEVHFADDLGYGESLRAAAMDNPDPDWRALGSSRLVLRPGEAWPNHPPGEFIFWVAWDDPNEALEAPTEIVERPISFERFTDDRPSRFGIVSAYPIMALLGVIAAAVVVYFLVTNVFGGKSSDSGITTTADGTKTVSCGSNPINMTQGDHAVVPLDQASLGKYQLSSVAVAPISRSAVAQGLAASVGQSNQLVLDAAMVPGQAGRLDEYQAQLSLVKGNTKVVSPCQVLIRAPATPPGPTPAPASATPSVSPTPAAGSTYTVVSGDTLNGIAAKQNITTDQRTAWLTQLRTLNNLTGDNINVGQTLKLPPKP